MASTSLHAWGQQEDAGMILYVADTRVGAACFGGNVSVRELGSISWRGQQAEV